MRPHKDGERLYEKYKEKYSVKLILSYISSINAFGVLMRTVSVYARKKRIIYYVSL